MTTHPGRSVPLSRARTGRRKSALPAYAGPAILKLKQWLRDQAGDTALEQIAVSACYSVSAVSNALGGAELPRLRLVLRIAAGINAPRGRAHELWWAAALEDLVKSSPTPVGMLAEYAFDLRKAMLKTDLGPKEVLQRMAKLCAAEGNVTTAMSRATLARLLTGTTLPRAGQMDVFLRVICLGDPDFARLRSRYEVLCAASSMVKSHVRNVRQLVATQGAA